MEQRKEKDPRHAPDEPTADRLPVEPEMQKGLDPDQSGRRPGNEPPKDKRVDNL
jgi:hypothetical protein